MLDLKARGWVRGGIDRFTAWTFADDLAMVLVDFTRYKADGSVLDAGRACYTVRRDGKAWKMLTIAEVKPPFLGPVTSRADARLFDRCDCTVKLANYIKIVIAA